MKLRPPSVVLNSIFMAFILLWAGCKGEPAADATLSAEDASPQQSAATVETNAAEQSEEPAAPDASLPSGETPNEETNGGETSIESTPAPMMAEEADPADASALAEGNVMAQSAETPAGDSAAGMEETDLPEVPADPQSAETAEAQEPPADPEDSTEMTSETDEETEIPDPILVAPDPEAEDLAAPETTPADAAVDADEESETVAEAEEQQPEEEIIPLLLIDEVELPTAIELLARQAGINFLFDPRIKAGEVGPDGAPMPTPMVSIRFENVTARSALHALLDNHNLELVSDPKTGISRVTPKVPGAPPPLVTEIVQLQHTSPTNLVDILTGTFTDQRSVVHADIRTSKLVIVATEPEQEDVAKLIERLDTATKQVLIEAHILETSQNPRSNKGIDWAPTLQNYNVSLGNGQTSYESVRTTPGQTTSRTLPSGRTVESRSNSDTSSIQQSLLDPLNGILGLSFNTSRGFDPKTAFIDANAVQATISFLNEALDAKVVSTPRTVTADNEKALLEVTRAFPIFTITPGSANSPAGAEITYTNMGTILEVTPRISASSNIALTVIPEVSNIDGQDRQILNGQENIANIYAVRRINTRVVVPSGKTLVMGGLISDTIGQTYTKVPILGDLPGIGLLFRKESKERQKANLMIFITPSIVGEYDFQDRVGVNDFLKSPMDMEPSGNLGGSHEEVDWDSPWVSGKPHDWSKRDEDAGYY